MATFGTFVSGQVLTAAELNATGTFGDYTPTWTQSATISKTVNWARYTQFNKLVQVSIKMTASSAGTANNKMLIGLPVDASANNFIMGTMVYHDASNVSELCLPVPAIYESANTVGFYPMSVNATVGTTPASSFYVRTDTPTLRFGQDFTYASGSAATGITVASTDIVYVQLTYEAA